ncbi:hypothetical protein B0H12DRAFT_1263872 [Mycena haematopus]|nr:hypothetical protein B0H12DRAFT_1263872 [Mycena haematopus]
MWLCSVLSALLMTESRLPPELERHIFELAANSHSKSIPTLLLVAHRVKIWLEPILYSVVVFVNPLPEHICFDSAHFSSAVQSPAISQHVTNLLLSRDVPFVHLAPILSRCSAVQNLALYGGDLRVLPFLSAMPLRRLSTALEDFLFPWVAIDFTDPPFSSLTHLQLRDDLDEAQWEEWRGLAMIPKLTHLAFALEKSLSIFQNTLTACPRLQVLIYLYSPGQAKPGIGLESLAHDTRFVCLPAPAYLADWQTGARGGDDFWVRAEKFIAQRNCGEIDRETFVLRTQFNTS